MKNRHFLPKSRGQIGSQTNFTRPDCRPEGQTDLLGGQDDSQEARFFESGLQEAKLATG